MGNKRIPYPGVGCKEKLNKAIEIKEKNFAQMARIHAFQFNQTAVKCLGKDVMSVFKGVLQPLIV